MNPTDVSIPQAEPPEGGGSAAGAPPPERPAPPPLQWPATSTAEPSTEVITPIAPIGTPAPAPSPKAGESCPACGAQMAPDQRYCLECGQRRGDPRLPFMDAVVLMDTLVKGPAPAAAAPATRGRRLSPNATLVAGIGTLLLALGVGVLIGHSGSSQNSPASTAPVVVKVPGSGEASAGTTKSGSGSTTVGGGASGAKATKSSKGAAATGASGQSKATEEILKPAKGVKLPPPAAKLGEKCSKGTAGCKGGKFTGEFFGG